MTTTLTDEVDTKRCSVVQVSENASEEPVGSELAASTRYTLNAIAPDGMTVCSGLSATLDKVTKLVSPADHTAVPAVFLGRVTVPNSFTTWPLFTTPVAESIEVATSEYWLGSTVTVTLVVDVRVVPPD